MSNQNLYYVGINVDTGRYVRMKSVVPGTITIDTQLDPLSQNPVANATLYTVLETKLTIPGGGSVGQAIIKTSNGFGWSTIPTLTIDTEIDSGSSNPVANSTLYTALSSKIDYPQGGSDGQVLTQSSGGVIWSSIPETTVDPLLNSSSPNPIANSAVYSALQDKASTDLATTSTAGLMAPGDKSKLEGLVTGYLGYFPTSSALVTSHAVGSNGQFANIGETDTIWTWDSDTSSWKDTGTATGTVTWDNISNKPNFATVASTGSYNDLSDKPVIPPAYTLPEATTSTLGGVMVDGSTIVISGGIISATTSGGGGLPSGGSDGQVLMMKNAEGYYTVESAGDAFFNGTYRLTTSANEYSTIHPEVYELNPIENESPGTSRCYLYYCDEDSMWCIKANSVSAVGDWISYDSSPVNATWESPATYDYPQPHVTYTAGNAGAVWTYALTESNTVPTPQLSDSSTRIPNTDWVTQKVNASGVPSGGSVGQVLGKTSSGVGWITVSSGGSITVDSALSPSSTNPVENRVVYSALQSKASTDVATSSASGLMSYQDKGKLDNLVSGYLGYYVSEYALYEAHPLGSNGQFVTVGDTKSLWVWDSIGSQWLNASVSVDSSLDASSSNPVESRAVTSALNTKITMPSGGSSGQVLTKTVNGTQWASVGGGGTGISTLSITRPVYMDYLYPVLEAADNQSFTSAVTMSLADGQTLAQSKCKVFNGVTWDNYADVGSLNYSYDNMPLVIDMSYFSTLTEPYWVRWKWVVDDSSSESTASDWESTKFPSAGDAEGQKVYNPVTGNIAGIKIAVITQEQYDLLDPKDANTIYLIVNKDESSSISGSI